MPNMAQGWGPQGFEPSGGPQTMTAEQKLASMVQAMGGAPNSVLQMIARILKSGEGSSQAQPPQPQNWDRMYQMPPARTVPGFENVNPAIPTPMRPSEPPVMLNPNPGFIRG